MNRVSDNIDLFNMLFKEDFNDQVMVDYIQDKMERQGWTIERILERYNAKPVKSIHRILNTPFADM